MGSNNKREFLETLKLYGKKCLIVLLGLILVFNTSAIADTIEGIADAVEEAAQEQPAAEAVPEAQVQNEDTGQEMSDVQADVQDVQLSVSTENVTLYTSDWQAITAYSVNASPKNDFKFFAQAFDGYENVVVTYDNNELYADGNGAYTIYATQLYTGGTIRATATAKPQEQPESVEAAENIENTDNSQGEDEGSESDDESDSDAPATTEEAPAQTEDTPSTDATTDATSDDASASDDESKSDVEVTDNTEAASTEAATTDEAATTEAAESEDEKEKSGSLLDWISGIFGGGATSLASDAGSTVNAGGSATIYVGETVTLQGTSGGQNKNHSWTSSDTSVATVSWNNSTQSYKATVTGVSTGKVTVTHTWKQYGSYHSETFTVQVGSAVAPTAISISGADSVEQFKSTQLKATFEPSGATGDVIWSVSDESIATIDENGNLTGVTAGKVTVTAATLNAKGSYITATKEVTVTRTSTSTDQATFYYMKTPDGDPSKNDSVWGPSLGNGTVNVTGGTFADNNKNLYNAQSRVVSWPSGIGTDNGDGTLAVTADSSTWNEIFNYYQSYLSQQYGVTITKDDVTEIKLVPYKISQNNGTTPDKHVDCTVSITCKSVSTATWEVWDAGASAYTYYDGTTVTAGNSVSLDGSSTKYRQSEPAAEKTVNGKKYIFDGWYTDSSRTGSKVTFPYEVSDNVTFYGKYIRADLAYTVKYVDENGKEIAASKTGTGKSAGATVVESAIDIKGYKLNDDATKSLDISETEENVITFKYKAKDGGRIGYNLTKDSATCAFPSDIEKDSGSNYKWYYNYAFEKGDTVDVISAKPTASDGSVFMGWLDKERDSQASAIRSAGETITYIYSRKTDYTLDALWASLVATGGEYTYDGTSHSIETKAGINEGTNLDQKYKDQALQHVSLNNDAQYRYSTDGGATWTDWSGTKPEFTNVGTYTVQVKQGVSVDGSVTTLEAQTTVTIKPAAVTVTANAASKTYGSADPTFTAEVSGLIGSDTINYTVSRTNTDENVGTYEGVIVPTDDATQGNYTVTYVPANFTITGKEVTGEMTVNDPSNSVYNGQEHKWTPEVKDGEKTLVEGEDYTVSYSTDDFTNVGSITVTITGKGNYTGSFTKNYQITKAPVTITTESKTKVYDGEALTASGKIEGIVAGETVSFKVTGSQTEVGESDNTYTLTWDGTAKESNYEIKSTTVGKLTVTESTQEIVVTTTGGEFTYDGKAHGATVEVTNLPKGYSVKTATSNATATDYTETPVTATADNLVIVNAKGEDVTSKLTIKKVDGSIKINKAQLNVTTPDATKVYDGSALTAEGSITGFVNGETAEFNTLGSQTEVGHSTNTYEIKWNGSAKLSNYNVNENLGELSVTQQTITDADKITVNSPQDKVYNGQEQKWSPVVTTTGDNPKTLVEGQDYTVSYDKTDFTNVTGTITVTITGINNYSGTVTRTYQITPVELTVTTESASKVYDGSALTAAGNISGFVNGETADFTVTGGQTKVGSSSNTYKLEWNGSAKSSNYKVTENLGTLTVTETTEEIVVTTTGGEFTYDGQAHGATVSVSTLPTGYKVQTATSSATATDVTTEAVAATADNLVIVNNEGEDVTSQLKITKVDGSITINPATLTITTPDAEKVYDGTALTATGSISGFVNGETATFTTTGSQTNVGTSENTYSLTWDGTAKESNYTVSATKGNLKVTEQNITDTGKITIDAPHDSVYNGTENKWVPVVKTTDGTITLVEGTDYDVTYSTTNFTDVQEITVTITAKGNYTGTITKTYKITPAPLTVKTESATKVYDGEALTAGGTITGFVDGETYTFTVTGTQTEVGTSKNTYELSYGTAKESNYSITSETIGDLTVTESEEAITVTVTGGSWTYDGSEHAATVTVSQLPKGYTLVEAKSNAKATDVTEGDGIAAKVDSLVIKNAKGEDVTSKLKITKVENDYVKVTPAPLTVVTNSASKTYDGTALTAAGTISGFVNGETAKFTVKGSQTDVGTSDNWYEIDWNGTAKQSNYSISESKGKLTVTQQTIADSDVVTISDPSDSVYDGKDHKWAPAVTNKNGATLTEGTDYEVSYDTEDFKDVKTIKVTITGKGNYSGTVTKTYKITPAPLTIKTASASKTYDGKALTKTDEYTFEGLVEGEKATFTVTGTQTKVGSSDNTYSLTWDGNAKQANYELKTVELGMLTVTESTDEIVVTTTGGTFTYDGAAHGATVTVTGLPEGYTVDTATSKATATNVADGTVAATADTLVIKNAEGDDVTSKLKITKVDGSITITPAELTVTTPDANKVYDGTPLTAEGSITGFVNNETATFTTTGTQTEVGSSENGYKLEWNGTAAESNYTVSATKGTLKVTQQTIDDETAITVGQLGDLVYNGQSQQQKPTVTKKDGTALTENVDYTISFSENTTNVGQVTVTVTGKGNYSGTVTRTYDITKRTVYVDTNTASKPYDGAELVGTATPQAAGETTGFVAGEGATFTATTIGPDVTKQTTNAITATTWNKGTLSSNYDVQNGTIGTLEITSAFGRVTVDSPSNVIYNGTDQTWVPTVKDGETTLVQGRDYTVEYSTDDRTNVTGAITVTIKGMGNYAGFESIQSYQITARTVNVSTNTQSKVYDGTELEGKATVEDATETTGFVAGEGATFTATTIGPDVTKQTTNAVTNVTWNEGTTSTNYNVVYTTGTLEITSQTIEDGDVITVGTLEDVVYNGSEQQQKPAVTTAGGTALTEGQDYTVSFSADTTNVGQVTVTITGTGNYSGTVTRTYNITQRTVYVDTNTDSKTYNGSQLTGTAAARAAEGDTGFVAGEGATFTGTTIGADVSQASNAWTLAAYNEGTKATNYNVVNGNLGTLEITKAELTITTENAEKKYDGAALTAGGSATGYVNGEVASLTVTGTQTLVGESKNTATFVMADKTFTINADETVTETATGDPEHATAKSSNYSLKFVVGALVVTDGTETDPVDPKGVITKTHEAGKYDLGDTVTFTITAKNIYDEPKTMTFSEQEGVTITGQTTFENVAAGAEVSTTATYTITEADILAGTFENTATVSFDGGKSFDGTDEATTEDSAGHITIVKKATSIPESKAGYALNETISYEITATNDGNVTLTDVTVTDKKTGDTWTKDSEGLTAEQQATLASMAPGATVTFTTTYTVTEADVKAGEVINEATATATPPEDVDFDVTPGTNTEPTEQAEASLAVVKTAAAAKDPAKGFQLGEEITYTIKVTNNGNQTVSDITVTDELTGNTGDKALATGVTLKPGESETYTAKYTVTEADLLNGSITNTAVATGKDTDGNEVKGEGSVTDGTEAKYAHSTISKETTSTAKAEDGKYALGEKITYKVTITNDGNLTLTNVKVTDKLEGAVLTSGEESIASLAPGESKELTYEYTVTEADVLAGKVVNEATGTSESSDPDNPDPTPTPGTDEDDTEEAKGSLVLTKTTTSTPANGTAYAANETITYKVEAENTGNVTLTNVVVTDALTGDEWTIESIAPKTKVEVGTASYTVTEADTLTKKSIANEVTATAKTPEGKDPEVTPGTTEDDIVEGTKGIQVVKGVTNAGKGSGTDGKFAEGDAIKYTITVENTGNTTLTNVKVTDELLGKTGVDAWTIAEIKPGATATVFTGEHVVTQADIIKGSVVNTATASATVPADGSTVTDTSSVTTGPGAAGGEIVDKNSHLTVTKETTSKPAEGNAYKLGETVSYKLTVTNDGNMTISNVTVVDELTGLSQNVGTLEPGKSATVETSHKVTEADVKAGKVVNVATATGKDPEGKDPTVEPGKKEDTTEKAEASLAVVKTSAAAKDTSKGFVVGEIINYTITVTNNGNQTVSDITVTDELTGNTGDKALATGVTLKPGESKEYTATYTVTEADVSKGSVTNVAKASGKDSDGKTVETTGEKTDTTEAKNSHLTVTKTTTSTAKAEDGKYALGETITYNVNVKNDGNQTIKNIKVTDQLEGAELGKAEGNTDTIAELAPGAEANVIYTYVVTEADVLAGKVVNNATAEGTDPDGDDPTVVPGEKEDKTEDAKSHLTVTKVTTNNEDGKKVFKAGETIEYTITVVNDGNQTINDVTIDDQRTGVQIAEGENANVGTLEPGQSAERHFTYEVTEADTLAGTTIVNNATAKGTTPDNVPDPTVDPGKTEDPNEKGEPKLEVTKTVTNKGTGENGKFVLGDTIDYSIKVQNTGNVTLTNVTVTDALLGNDWTKTIETFVAGAEAVYEGSHVVTEADIRAGKVENTAVAEGIAQADPSKTAKDEDTVKTGDGGQGGDIDTKNSHLTVEKTTTNKKDVFNVDETIEYTVTVTNDGNQTISGVAITDTITCAHPENLVTVSDTGQTTLAPKEVRTATYSYTVTQDDVDSTQITKVANNAVATGTDPDGDKPGVTPGGTEDPIPSQSPALTVVKTADKTADVKAGDVVTYTITVTNSGNTTVNNVEVTDDLEGATLKSDSGETTLAPNAKRTVVYEYTVTETDVIKGSVYNKAIAKGTDPSGNETSGEGEKTIETEKATATYSIEKTTVNKDVDATGTAADGSKAYKSGDTIHYEIKVTNTGNTTLKNLKVVDPLTGLEVTKDELAPNDEPWVIETSYEVKDTDVIKGSVLNEATVSGESPDPVVPNPDPTPGTDEEKTEDVDSTVTVEKTSTNAGQGTGTNGAFRTGDTINYQIVVTNNGNVTVKNITVTDELTNNTWTIAELAAGASQTFTATHVVTAAEGAAGSVTNVATATGEIDNPSDPSNPTPITPANGQVTDTTEPAPVTPVNPGDNPAPTPDGGDGGNLPAPLNVIVPALAAAAEPIVEAIEGPAAEVIDDEGTPLAGSAQHCWVHFYIILGILVTLVYVAGVILRRVRFGQKVHDYDDDMLDKGNTGKTDETADPTTTLGVQPALAQGTEA